MARTNVNDRRDVPKNEPFSFNRRLGEIEMFFQKRSKQHQTMRRLVKRLESAGIPYAIVGAMAVNAHGAQRTTNDVDVLLTREGVKLFRTKFLGKEYDQVPGRPRRFIERQSGVGVDVLLTGHYPGRGDPGPFAFPDPEETSVEIEKNRVVNLPQLIQLKLAAGRHYDLGDVGFLIRVHNLDESFLEKIHPSVHPHYLACLDEAREDKRREEEYESRED